MSADNFTLYSLLVIMLTAGFASDASTAWIAALIFFGGSLLGLGFEFVVWLWSKRGKRKRKQKDF